VPLEPGDVIRIVGAGAGGWGNPLERPVELVLKDVRCGFLSPVKARAEYGVVIRDGVVDEKATTALRAELAPRLSNEHFDYGEQRRAFDAVWTRERYEVLTQILAGVPIVWRYFLKHKIFEALAAEERPEEGGTAVIERIWRALRAQYPELAEAEAEAAE
jgi:N-methylhydantoinase B